jgi:hypothetical protein
VRERMRSSSLRLMHLVASIPSIVGILWVVAIKWVT